MARRALFPSVFQSYFAQQTAAPRFYDGNMTPVSSAPAATAAKLPPGRPARVLYAEDERDLRDVIGILLRNEGYELETATNGREAFERLSRDPAYFDLLITDHHMPEWNGLELVEHLPSIPFHGQVMVFSSEIDPAVHERYHHLGVNLVLPKPIRPSVMRETLAKLLASRAG